MSSNATEGLFSRAKRHLHTYRGCPQSKEQVGDYFGEFLFREQVGDYLERVGPDFLKPGQSLGGTGLWWSS